MNPKISLHQGLVSLSMAALADTLNPSFRKVIQKSTYNVEALRALVVKKRHKPLHLRRPLQIGQLDQ